MLAKTGYFVWVANIDGSKDLSKPPGPVISCHTYTNVGAIPEGDLILIKWYLIPAYNLANAKLSGFDLVDPYNGFDERQKLVKDSWFLIRFWSCGSFLKAKTHPTRSSITE